ncbi:MAG: hypothetical protein ABSF12_06530 [Bryobacteraceae bacterium]|jgi:hypothetical protein
MKIFLCFILGAAANATTVFIDSNAADTTNNSGHATVDMPWALALPGSLWISNDPEGEDRGPEFFSPVDETDITFVTMFTLSGAITGGGLTVLADDITSVILNGHKLPRADLTLGFACAKGPLWCLPPTAEVFTFAELAPYLVDGSNTLSFGVMQFTGSFFGLDFAGVVDTAALDPPPTPEPSTLASISGGLLLLAAGSVLKARRAGTSFGNLRCARKFSPV